MNFTSLFTIALGAILVNNFIFAQFLGICPFMGVSKKIDTATGMGIAVIFVMGVASIFTWVVNEFLLVPMHLEFMQTIAYILVIACLVQFVEMFLQKSMPSLYQALGIYLPLITTNCAVLGIPLLNVALHHDLLESLLFGFGSSVGFSLALVLFAGIRERLDGADVPVNFKGTAIAMVTAGIMSLAFMGFAGLDKYH